MRYLPISIKIEDKKILIIGGGKVALQKVRLLKEFSGNIVVVATQISDEISDIISTCNTKEYEKSDLNGFDIIYACTNNEELNKRISSDSKATGKLVNVADNPELCDFVSPAIYKKDNITVAVGSDARDVKLAIKIRDKIKSFLLHENHIPENNKAQSYLIKYENATRVILSRIKKIFNQTEELGTPGIVTLVGFGPGNPDLITIKGNKALEKADIIFYDDLIDSEYLSSFPEAEKVYVGKRRGSHSNSQDRINKLLYEAATKGKQVVRLKGGDPFIFGRGGEEFKYLCERSIDVSVVPGITAASAAAALYGFPLTHRGKSSSVAFCTGHPESKITVPKTDTIVYYMGAAGIKKIAEKVIEAGWSEFQEVVLLNNISMPDHNTEIMTLKELKETDREFSTPLLAIICKTLYL
jgi:uroporphyrin-III C-methyltransferase/precorrin-2 dehydrogenase/sirohydrochlorin ferrochelatase